VERRISDLRYEVTKDLRGMVVVRQDWDEGVTSTAYSISRHLRRGNRSRLHGHSIFDRNLSPLVEEVLKGNGILPGGTTVALAIDPCV